MNKNVYFQIEIFVVILKIILHEIDDPKLENEDEGSQSEQDLEAKKSDIVGPSDVGPAAGDKFNSSTMQIEQNKREETADDKFWKENMEICAPKISAVPLNQEIIDAKITQYNDDSTFIIWNLHIIVEFEIVEQESKIKRVKHFGNRHTSIKEIIGLV